MIHNVEKIDPTQSGGNLDPNNPPKDNKEEKVFEKNSFNFPDTTLTTFYEIDEETGERRVVGEKKYVSIDVVNRLVKSLISFNNTMIAEMSNIYEYE